MLQDIDLLYRSPHDSLWLSSMQTGPLGATHAFCPEGPVWPLGFQLMCGSSHHESLHFTILFVLVAWWDSRS